MELERVGNVFLISFCAVNADGRVKLESPSKKTNH